ncbi:MAG: DUF502 domain-containing protein [Chromatiales bacterium]|nr:DUF502 domain-containing protein [Chromatiales bacterium]
MLSSLRRYLMAGLLVWLPLMATILVVGMLIDAMDFILHLVPVEYHPMTLFGFDIPGFGLFLALVILLLTGVIVANIFGRKLVALWEAILARIPLVSSIYSAVKQISETMFSTNGNSFRKVLLVEYPRKGLWTLAFQTGTTVGEAQRKTGCEVINIYVPTTPNPTSGFFIMVPKEDVIELEMSVDEGLRMIISMGSVVPAERAAKLTEQKAV